MLNCLLLIHTVMILCRVTRSVLSVIGDVTKLKRNNFHEDSTATEAVLLVAGTFPLLPNASVVHSCVLSVTFTALKHRHSQESFAIIGHLSSFLPQRHERYWHGSLLLARRLIWIAAPVKTMQPSAVSGMNLT